jgi:hypothetical protein
LEFAHRRVLQREHHLEQRRVAQAPFGLQLFDQTLERHFLMRVGFQGHVAHLAEQFMERHLLVKPRAHDERVDEEPDEVLGLPLIASRDGRARENIALAGVACEQCLPCGEQRHEHRRALLARQSS